MNFCFSLVINGESFLKTLVNIKIPPITKEKNIMVITTSPKSMKNSSTPTECTKILSLSHYLTIGNCNSLKKLTYFIIVNTSLVLAGIYKFSLRPILMKLLHIYSMR